MAHQPECEPATQPADEPDAGTGAAILPFPSLGVRHESPPAPQAEPRLRSVIGAVLRDERQAQGRTLADVAESAAVSLPYLSEVERGTKEVSSDLLAAIGDALDLDLADVLERSVRRIRAGSFSGLVALAA